MRRKTILPIAVVLTLLCLLAGCRSSPASSSYYPLELWTTASQSTLTIDSIRYHADNSLVAPRGKPRDQWLFTGEPEEKIGVCGESSGNFDIYTIKGDEEQRFLYICQNYFSFGPYTDLFFVREDVALSPPEAGSISRAVLDSLPEITAPEQIAALLDVYYDSGSQGLEQPDGGRVFDLVLHHSAYPFLSFLLWGYYDEETQAYYLSCQDGALRRIP